MKVSILLGSFVMVASFACGGAPATPPAAASASPANTATVVTPAPASTAATTSNAKMIKAPGEATIGDTSTCPISKEEFTITSSSPKATHNGKTYYFCCAGCEKKFNADPAKYVSDASKK